MKIPFFKQESIVRGEVVRIEDKLISPIVEVSVISGGFRGESCYVSASPTSVLVVDESGQYVIPLLPAKDAEQE